MTKCTWFYQYSYLAAVGRNLLKFIVLQCELQFVNIITIRTNECIQFYDNHNMTHTQDPTCFRPHWPIIREHNCTKQTGQWGLKWVGATVCCNSETLIKLCAFGFSNCNNWTAMHRKENVKFYQQFSKFIHTLLWSFKKHLKCVFPYLTAIHCRKKKVSAFTISFHNFFTFVMASMYSTVSKRVQLTAAGKLSQTPEPYFQCTAFIWFHNLIKYQ